MSGMFGSNIRCNLLWILPIDPLDYGHGTITLSGMAFQPTCPRQKARARVQTPHLFLLTKEDSVCPLRISVDLTPRISSMSFPPGTRMLRFPGCPVLNGLIQRSWDQPLLAGPPCFSQLATSFFGSQTQPFTNGLLNF